MSRIWALADLHLCHSCPQKDMTVFGPSWSGYMERIEKGWRSCVSEEDWVLLPGDITWAMKFEQALIDLAWIEQLPGKKVLSKGNHDYWWPSAGKWQKAGFKTLFNAQQQLVEIDPECAVIGVRFADSSEYSFESIIDWNPLKPKPSLAIDEEVFQKEIQRLEEALKLFKPKHKKRLAMIHYPPIGLALAPSKASQLLEKFGVTDCVFGHLHSLKKESAPFGHLGGIHYIFCAADYVDFKPVEVGSL